MNLSLFLFARRKGVKKHGQNIDADLKMQVHYTLPKKTMQEKTGIRVYRHCVDRRRKGMIKYRKIRHSLERGRKNLRDKRRERKCLSIQEKGSIILFAIIAG
mgnify:CR=1 FL=1